MTQMARNRLFLPWLAVMVCLGAHLVGQCPEAGEVLTPPSGESLSIFGLSIDFSGDTAIVGAWEGGIAVYRKVDGVWVDQPSARLTSGKDPRFDGARLVTAAYGQSVTVHRLEDGDEGPYWVQEGRLEPWDGPKSSFALSGHMAIDGDLVAVGAHDEEVDGVGNAGVIYVFRREAEGWVPDARVENPFPLPYGLFGWQVELDGDVLVSRAGGENTDPGRVLLLQRLEPGVWELGQEITSPNPPGEVDFGRFALSEHWLFVAHGNARPQSSLVVFGRSGIDVSAGAELELPVGHTLAGAMIARGDRLVVSAFDKSAPAELRGLALEFSGAGWEELDRTVVTRDNSNAPIIRAAMNEDGQVCFGVFQPANGHGLVWDPKAGPSPAISVTPEAGVLPGEPMMFDGARSIPPAAAEISGYHWTFGDGLELEGEQVSHAYAEPGVQQVELSAAGSNGSCKSVSTLVTVGCPPGDVAPWTAVDVGDVGIPGAATMTESGAIVLCTGGRSLTTSADAFHFVRQESSGDFALRARISEISDGSGNAVGIMARESLDEDAPHVALVVESLLGLSLRLVVRESKGARSRSTKVSSVTLPDTWLRLRRTGERIEAGVSEDGETWTSVRVFEGFPSTSQVGVAATAKVVADRPFAPLSATVEDLQLEVVSDAPKFQRGDCNDDGDTDLSDAVCILGWLFLGAEAPGCIAATNTNGDAKPDISDATYLLGHLFLGGPSPAPPFPGCGPGTLPPDEGSCETPPTACRG